MILSYHIWIIYNTKDSKFTEINVVIIAISAKLSVWLPQTECMMFQQSL